MITRSKTKKNIQANRPQIEDETSRFSSSSSASLFPSVPSSQSFRITPTPSSSSISIQSVDVVQETNFVDDTVPTTSTATTRRRWNTEMNKFILRTYLHLTNLETDKNAYLPPLHTKFLEKYPNMQVSRQRIGDQRRAIIQRRLLPQNIIDQIYEEVRAELHIFHTQTQQQSTQLKTPVTTQSGQRMRWSNECNEAIIRIYYTVTQLETNTTAYRKHLHEEFINTYPELAHITEQRLSDQMRAIINNKYINQHRLAEIKKQVAEELRDSCISSQTEYINNEDLNTQPHNNIDSLDECILTLNTSHTDPHLCDTTTNNPTTNILPNDNPHNDVSITLLNTDGNNLNDIDIEQFCPTQIIVQGTPEFNPEVEDTFQQAQQYFTDTHPTNRPYIPKQKSSRKLSANVMYINTVILPKLVNVDTDFTTLQTIIYCAAWTAAKCNGAKISDSTQNVRQTNIQRKPKWQFRLEKKIGNLRANIGRLTQFIRGNTSRKVVAAVEAIKTKYQLHAQHENINTQIEHFLDTLKQKLNAASSRLKRYITCTNRKIQNTKFINNEKIFYRNLTSNNRDTSNQSLETPSSETLREFWANIWENPVYHNNLADWVSEATPEIPEMECEAIPIDTFIDVINRTHNWKSPGTDNIHNYWYKKFTSVHPYIYNHLNTFIQSPHLLPTYITHGVTYMIPKDMNDTIDPSKYRPITCLQTLYKILTACISKLVSEHLTKNNILAEQQKGCRKNSQGCKEQLTIDAITMKSALKSKKDIHTMFIDYQKAFDSVPHSWLLHVLNLYKIHPTLKLFLETSMQNWQTVLKINLSSTTVATEPVCIKRGIFQGDALSPLWFCMALNPLSHLLDKTGTGFTLTNNNTEYNLTHLMYMDDIKLYAADQSGLFQLADTTQQFSQDICMQFGVDKCKILSVVKGKIQNNSYILGSGKPIEPMDEQSTYKYLGFKQSRQIQQKTTKQELLKNFTHRLNLILKTNLNSRNTIKAINTFAIPILTYSFGIIQWSKTDIKKLQRTANTLLTKHRKHHPKSCVQRLTLPRQEGGRGLIDIHNLHNKQILSLRSYFHKKSEHSSLHKQVTEADKRLTPLNLQNRNTQLNEHIISTQQKIAAWSGKALHGRHRAYLSQPHVDKVKSNEWLKRGKLFPETEGFMLAIQDQIIATRNYRKHIIKDANQPTDLCRHCNNASETIQHITGACKSLAQTDYKHRHDQVASIIHQHLAHKYKLIDEMIPYYKYKPEVIIENRNQKIYWDRTIITDKTIHYNRPDITVHDKINKTVYLIDIAIPNSHNIQTTISEKLSKYQDLAIEIKNQWKAQTVHIVPIVLSSTGVVPKSLTQSLNTLHMPNHTLHMLQKATILNTCRITRKFLTSSTLSSTFSI